MKILSKLEYGSSNYGLAGLQSDYDYKIIVTPQFNDFYYEKKLKLVGEYYNDPHYTLLDIRKFASQLQNSNFSAIELLYSVDREDKCELFGDFFTAAKALYDGGYLNLVWAPAIKSLKGAAISSINNTNKGVSRAYYYFMFALNAVRNNFKLSDEVWRGPNTSWWPRQIKFSEIDISCNMTSLSQMFDELEQMGCEWINYDKSMYEAANALEYYAKKIVKEFMYEIQY